MVMATKAELERQIKELQAQIPTDKPLEADSIDGAHDGLVLVVRNESFECRRVDVSYQMMLFAQAQRKASVHIPKGMPEGPRKEELKRIRNEAGMSLMDTMLTTVQILLKPHERDRFHNYMMELGLSDNPLSPGEFQDAIGEVIAAAGGAEGKEPTEETTSSPSYSSSQTTSENSVASSFKKAGVEDKLPANS